MFQAMSSWASTISTGRSLPFTGSYSASRYPALRGPGAVCVGVNEPHGSRLTDQGEVLRRQVVGDQARGCNKAVDVRALVVVRCVHAGAYQPDDYVRACTPQRLAVRAIVRVDVQLV